ncbi:MAG: NTP transferase domain-containing protein [Deltaproteobacteria bacterium]|nr:NTP transferase domain-containing protein [Deltaproteobacteria bacterium]
MELKKEIAIASLVFAAGKGSRMKGFDGNKTLLPLEPSFSPFQGDRPILLHILGRLPDGPKAVVVHHRKEEVIHTTRGLGVAYYEQPVLNGTGGALLAAREFVEAGNHDRLIITMGDVPFVKRETYLGLVRALRFHHLVILGFTPRDRKKYGVLETEGERVRRITEWKYWKDFPEERRGTLRICNSGIYAARTRDLIPYLETLGKNPHRVLKERDGRKVEIEEFFITDLVEWMVQDALHVGYGLAADENEVMGIDDLPSLLRAQHYSRPAGTKDTPSPLT